MTSDTTDNSEQGPEQETSHKRRFIISHRIAPYRDGRARRSAKGNFSERLMRALGDSANVLSDSGADRDDIRRVMVVMADEAELRAKSGDLSPDTIIEEEALRWPSALRLAPWGTPSLVSPVQSSGDDAGIVSPPPFILTITAAGAPLAGVQIELSLTATSPSASSSSVSSLSAVTDENGKAVLPFDTTQWFAVTAQISPHGRAWSGMIVHPVAGSTVDLACLPKAGPLGWWHQLAGISTFDPQAGAGIRVGVIDSGLGPHPYLSHVIPAGAFINGTFQPGPEATADVQWHGTHVSGLIGARPPLDSGEYAGLAPAAEVFTARVFAKGQGANQGDIASAIDVMSIAHEVDLINLSLGGSPSAIEYDAILAAYARGTLCICAAGNDFGQPVLAPASYPLAVAVSAVTMPGTFPPNNMANLTRPPQLDHYGTGGIFLPTYSNFGRQVAVTAGGSAVISTVPAWDGEHAPYADMSGTSMATPVTTGALAAMLSRDAIYRSLQRTQARAKYARSRLEGAALSIGLVQPYQGQGLSRAN